MIPVFILGSPSQRLLEFFSSNAFQVAVLENIRNPGQIPNSLLPTEKKYIVVPGGSQPQTSPATLEQIVLNLPKDFPLVILSGNSPGTFQANIPETLFQIRDIQKPLTTQDAYIRQPGTISQIFQIAPGVFSSPSQPSDTFNWQALFILILVGFLMLAMTIFMVNSQKDCNGTTSSPSSPGRKSAKPEE